MTFLICFLGVENPLPGLTERFRMLMIAINSQLRLFASINRLTAEDLEDLCGFLRVRVAGMIEKDTQFDDPSTYASAVVRNSWYDVLRRRFPRYRVHLIAGTVPEAVFGDARFERRADTLRLRAARIDAYTLRASKSVMNAIRKHPAVVRCQVISGVRPLALDEAMENQIPWHDSGFTTLLVADALDVLEAKGGVWALRVGVARLVWLEGLSKADVARKVNIPLRRAKEYLSRVKQEVYEMLHD